MQQLRTFIQNLSPEITDLELDYIIGKFKIKLFGKDKFLIKEQQICTDFSIVEKGCFRIFYKKEDREINSWFAFELTPITEMHSFITQKPSDYYIQAVESSEVYSISHTDLKELYRQFNSFQKFGFQLTEIILVKVIERLKAFQFETAEERYNKILHDQNYTQRLPLKDLASFLGVTPNSLSRLRNNFKK